MTTLLQQTFTQRLAHQAEVTFRSGSTYVVLAIVTAVGLFNSLDATQQAAVLSAFPFLKGWGGVVTAVVAFLGTKIKPSNAVSTQTAELMATIQRMKLNDYLRAHGAPPLPDPQTPVPPVPVAAIPTVAAAVNVTDLPEQSDLDFAGFRAALKWRDPSLTDAQVLGAWKTVSTQKTVDIAT